MFEVIVSFQAHARTYECDIEFNSMMTPSNGPTIESHFLKVIPLHVELMRSLGACKEQKQTFCEYTRVPLDKDDELR